MIAPVPLAMVLCDSVIIDQRTDKKSLIGIFSNIGAESFPFRSQHFSIFISLTDGHGDYMGRLVCSDSDRRDIFEATGQITFPGGAKTVVEMVYDIAGLVFPQEGTFNFSFYCDEEIVISRECSVVSAKQKPPEEPEEEDEDEEEEEEEEE